MKTYEVELRRTSYITVTVEAKDIDEAEMLAFKEIETRGDSDYADWAIESMEEKK